MASVTISTDTTLEEVVTAVEEQSIEFIRFEFSGMSGISRCKVVPSRHLRDKSTRGLRISLLHFATDAASNPAEGSGYCAEICWADGLFLPDPSTYCTVPWQSKTGLVLMEAWADGRPLPACPRSLARRQLDRMSRLGYSLLSAHEHEFYVVGAESKKPLHGGNLRSSLANFADEGLLYALAKGLEGLGVDVEAMDTELSPGQVEITYKPSLGIRAADQAYLYRTAVKEIARQRGYVASFMSKPWDNQSGSSAHFCHSLWDAQGRRSAMSDPSAELGISEVACHWMAGILAHAPAISLLMAPTTNCRRRYRHFSFSPINSTWGLDNRTCALRLKVGDGEDGTYLENRMGASASNPYLTMAATVAAGVDGIEKRLPLPARVVGEAYRPADVPPGTADLPATLQGAVDAFREDAVIREAFGEEFCRAFLAIKQLEIEREKEAAEKGDTEWEFNTYFYIS